VESRENYYFCLREYNDFSCFSMHLLLKNITSFSLLLLVISHGVIQFGMFELFRADYRAEAARLIGAGVPGHNRIVFSFNKEEFSRVEWKDDEEFRFEGKLFDVIQKEVKGDSVLLYCLYDEDDTILYSVLDSLIEDDKDVPEETDGFGISLSQFYFCEDFNLNIDSPGCDDKIFISCEMNPLAGELQITTPPPRFIG
jgi:hypothetical protein